MGKEEALELQINGWWMNANWIQICSIIGVHWSGLVIYKEWLVENDWKSYFWIELMSPQKEQNEKFKE